MKKLLITIILLFFSITSDAATFQQAQEIYQKLIKNNHIGGPILVYSNSMVVNAYTNSKSIKITRGMLLFVQNRDELALILGHELAHYNLHHPGSTPKREYEADHLGGVYMSHIGGNICHGAEVIKRFHDNGSNTHPPSNLRYLQLCK